jgi:hypothetical protein
MAKKKKQSVEVELFSGFSEQSAGQEGREDTAQRIEQNSTERHAHEARLSAFADFVTHALSLSDEIAVERNSEGRINESRHQFDWNIITDHGELIRLLIPSSGVAIALITGASKYFSEVGKAGGATVKVGKKSIQVGNIDDIEKAVAAVQKLAELPGSAAPVKEKKAGAKKKAPETIKPNESHAVDPEEKQRPATDTKNGGPHRLNALDSNRPSREGTGQITRCTRRLSSRYQFHYPHLPHPCATTNALIVTIYGFGQSGCPQKDGAFSGSLHDRQRDNRSRLQPFHEF